MFSYPNSLDCEPRPNGATQYLFMISEGRYVFIDKLNKCLNWHMERGWLAVSADRQVGWLRELAYTSGQRRGLSGVFGLKCAVQFSQHYVVTSG